PIAASLAFFAAIGRKASTSSKSSKQTGRRCRPRTNVLRCGASSSRCALESKPFPSHCVTRLPMRVRFFETDLMGIVHHAAYLTYAEAGRVEYLRRRGADYRGLMERGLHMPVVEAELKFRRAARFDDELVVETRLGALSRVTVRFDYDVLRG